MRHAFRRQATAAALCCFAVFGLILTLSTPAAAQPDNGSHVGPPPSTPKSKDSEPYVPTQPDGKGNPASPSNPPTGGSGEKPSQEPAENTEGSAGNPADPPTDNRTTQSSPKPSDRPTDKPNPKPSRKPADRPTGTLTPKPSQRPPGGLPPKSSTQKPTDKSEADRREGSKNSPYDTRRQPRTSPHRDTPRPPDGRFSSQSSGGKPPQPDTGNGGANWVPQSPSGGAGSAAEQNQGAVTDPVPTPEQAELEKQGKQSFALKGSQAGASDNPEARSASLLWGGLTIVLGLAVIVSAWLFLCRSPKPAKDTAGSTEDNPAGSAE